LSPFFLIDTSAWFFTFGQNPVQLIKERVEHLLEQNQAAITSPIAYEIFSGVKCDLPTLKTYLSTLHPFPFIAEEWSETAVWTQEMRRKGTKMKTMDALIAYKALKHDLTLLHADADMDRIARQCSLRTESYVEQVRKATR
jgi:predicted nucleic acid-binding protein